MLLDVQQTLCCAAMELHGISEQDTKDSITDVCNIFYRPPYQKMVYSYTKGYAEATGKKMPEEWKFPAFLIFTQANEHDDDDVIEFSYGYDLENFITDHKLGAVVKTLPACNPNTSNDVVVFVWSVDSKALSKWAQDHNCRESEE